MAEQRQGDVETFEVRSLEDLLKGRGELSEIKVSAQPMRDENNNYTWLFVLAGYRYNGDTQESHGHAWTTAADGKTPKKVGSLHVQVEVAGSTTSWLGADNINSVGTGTRGSYSSVPQRVVARAMSKNPDIQAEDTTDD